jgi:prephenate dehydrogenase
MGLYFEKTAIIGVGLVGGSVGLGRSRASVEKGLEQGAIDEAVENVQEAVDAADLIVVCTPVGSIAGIIAEMNKSIDEDCIITDVGSTKQNLVRAVEQLPRARSRFVGSHPLAGSEKKGVQYARADLFEGATVFLTPTPTTNKDVASKAREMWQCLGGRVVEFEPDVHDRIVAYTSHLPHICAALLVTCLRSLPDGNMPLMGKGFLDSTRIASSDPEMWADICMENIDEIRQALFSLRKDLDEFELYLDESEYERILEFFRTAKRVRDSFDCGSDGG